MKRSIAFLLLAATIATACTGDDSVSFWTGVPEFDASGQVSNVDEYNDHLETSDPPYRTNAGSAGGIFARVETNTEGELTSITTNPGAGSGETDVIIIVDGQLDDSVAATKLLLVFVDAAIVGGTSGDQQLLFGQIEYRCQPGRGQQAFAPDLCT